MKRNLTVHKIKDEITSIKNKPVTKQQQIQGKEEIHILPENTNKYMINFVSFTTNNILIKSVFF